MPGQRYRSESTAAATPEPDPIAEREPAPPDADEQITAYEHVLQRARRIRASKQERMRPIRHTDILPGREYAAAVAWSGHDRRADDRHVNYAAAPAAPAEAYPAHDDLDWDDASQEPLDDWIDEQGEITGAWDDPANDGLQAATWDEDDSWDEPYVEPVAASWDDEEDEYWDDDDADAVYAPEPRRLGWLSRLRLGRRSTEPIYDDATITRHADASQDDLDDEPFPGDQDWPADDTPPAPLWDDTLTNDREREPVQHDLGWASRGGDPGTSWNGVDDHDIPEWRESSRHHTDTEAAPVSAPIPAPVPASERAGEAWNIASMPVRPAMPQRSRQRLESALPDLDDALFDERDGRTIQADGAYGMPVERANTPVQPSIPARDSYFRASRYPRPEPDALDASSTLPDLDSDRLDVRDVVAQGAELVDRRIDVAPDIPRQCRTCRSFRSADGGTRGWCTNEWAFTHRRMVNDDDLACVSAIGCWWLPADHLSLDLDDAYDDVRTPRMDELIASRRPATRRVVGE